MADKLPDELIKEIISPVLRVPEEMFADMQSESVFCRFEISTSTILLVCKRWLRVATPLLYEVVVLRSKAQAQVLAGVLKANKLFGAFIKKLRVEGGYGAPMHRILTAAPNIKELYVTLALWSNDSVSGLCRSLHRIDPSRLLIHDLIDSPHANSAGTQLATALCECIQHKWKNLKVVQSPMVHGGRGWVRDRSGLIAQREAMFRRALSQAPALETIIYEQSPNQLIEYYNHAKVIPRNPHVKSIIFKTRACDTLVNQMKEIPGLLDVITFELPKKPASEPEPPTPSLLFLDPSYIPFASAPEDIGDQVWTRIFSFAMQIEFRDRELTEVDVGTLRKAQVGNTSVALMQVSKTFHRLTLPLLYGYPILDSIPPLRAFSTRLIANPSLGLLVRSLAVSNTDFFSHHDEDGLWDVVSRTPHLQRLYAPGGLERSLICFSLASLDLRTFVALAKTAGSTLVTFKNANVCSSHDNDSDNDNDSDEDDDGDDVLPGSILANFKSIRDLEWMSTVEFSAVTPSSSWLSTLETLKLSEFHVSFLKILSALRLPSLVGVDIVVGRGAENQFERFVSSHGGKLQDLKIRSRDAITISIFDMCPRLTSVTLNDFYVMPRSSVFRCKSDHKHLLKVTIPNESHYSIVRDHHFQKEWVTLFAELDLSAFSSLREIQIYGCEWPTNERAMTKNPWPKWAEETKEKWNVTITDGQGRAWKPRLKIQK
ncbi:hypothetical protein JAAARDRAFT_77323 [Jaapia argillacea MUCL 33604]|uniref:Uncharacterized protein n=1 Tax=Jaapia argillacea MUCL 33604 TaxID=933084 RepID=A0A067QBU8_9AGAM|nr:hypothetical protein JAAARDRAFT_77323 [Jaapia argillacea MUCL 33604]